MVKPAGNKSFCSAKYDQKTPVASVKFQKKNTNHKLNGHAEPQRVTEKTGRLYQNRQNCKTLPALGRLPTHDYRLSAQNAFFGSSVFAGSFSFPSMVRI